MFVNEEERVTYLNRNERKMEVVSWCGLPLLRTKRNYGSSTKKMHVGCWRASIHHSSALHPLPQLAVEAQIEHSTIKDAVGCFRPSADHSSALHPHPQVALEPRIDNSPVNYAPDAEANEDTLSSLLHHSDDSVFPIQKFSEKQKLAWLQSQMIGDHREFKTPFGMRRLLYADHTASGRCLHFIERFLQEHVLPLYGNTHTEDSYVGSFMGKMTLSAHRYLKNVLGASENDVLIMCGSGCTAAIKRLQEVMGVAVPSPIRQELLDNIARSPSAERERWIVFVGPYEHHSNLLSWRQSLVEVKEISSTGKGGYIDMERLEEELRLARASGRKNILGAFSACSNVTGLYTDTRAIARLLHRHGALAFFDFAAGAPHIEIDMRSDKEDGYDAIAVSPHKLIGGPGAPGILLMKKSLYKLGKQPPSTCGGGTVAYVNGFDEEVTLQRSYFK
ncbi:hypothetical protein KP509_39G015800 [Ceratopteris richardii]|uniref:Aminotransferase class V domain-containing protein n=1 Tax=Ceratopteris richardii TaxID=49495 RepID=A0A8T2PZ00_CERRI|nr:hypothetical protein KP509_39G015800 [Ceratopteris richardii]